MMDWSKRDHPAVQFGITMMGIFLGEGIIMIALNLAGILQAHGGQRGWASPLLIGLLDSVLLTVIVFPLLYFFMLKPLFRRQREQAQELDRRNQYFQLMAENVNEVFWLFNHDFSECLYINEQYEEIHGAGRDSVYEDPTSFLDVAHPEDRPRIEQAMETVKGGDPVDLEWRVNPEEDFSRWIWVKAVPVKNESGEVERITGTSTDITRRKNMEQRLANREKAIRELYQISSKANQPVEEKLRKLMTHGLDYLDMDFGYVTKIDNEQQVITKAVGNPPDSVSQGKTTDLKRSFCRAVREQQDVVSFFGRENTRWEDDPATDNFDFRSYIGAPVRIGNEFHGTVCFGSTEAVNPDSRSKYESYLELLSRWVSYEYEQRTANREIERLSNALDEATDAVFITDPDGVIAYVNEGFEEMTGYDRSDVIGKTPDILKSGEHDEEFYEELWNTISSGEQFRTIVINQTKSGELIHCDETIRPVMDNGDVDHYVASLKDVTALKETEEQLEEALDQKETLLQEVYHRVKNNMQVISSMLKLQRDKLDDPPVKKQLQESVNRIQSMSMIHELLYDSEQLQSVDIGQYLRELVDHLRRTYRDETGDVSFDLSVNVDELDLDTAIPCGLIVTELSSNALQHGFGPESDGEVSLKLDHENDGYQLTVSDTGEGLPEDFSREQSSSLGLELVEALVEGNLKGTLSMERNEPGTRIDVWFSK